MLMSVPQLLKFIFSANLYVLSLILGYEKNDNKFIKSPLHSCVLAM